MERNDLPSTDPHRLIRGALKRTANEIVLHTETLLSIIDTPNLGRDYLRIPEENLRVSASLKISHFSSDFFLW